jgi:iron complex transport system substrate-binding protein
MKILGQIFQEEEKAEEVSAFIKEQFDLIASKNLNKKDKIPTVYYEKSAYSQVFGSTATSKSGWGLPIKIAGGNNIADEVLLNTAASGGAGNTLDPEYVLEKNPDFIILSGINDGWLDILKKKEAPSFDVLNRNGWKNLNAVTKGNVYEFAHSTSRSIYAFYPTLKMAKIFYPEEFTDLDPEAVLEEFFEKYMLLGTDISTWFIEADTVNGNK